MRILLALTFLISTAFAQESQVPQRLPHCNTADQPIPHDMMKAVLWEKYQEGPINIGITKPDPMLMEFYASQPGTWTIVLTAMLTGQSCIDSWGVNLRSKSLIPEQRV